MKKPQPINLIGCGSSLKRMLAAFKVIMSASEFYRKTKKSDEGEANLEVKNKLAGRSLKRILATLEVIDWRVKEFFLIDPAAIADIDVEVASPFVVENAYQLFIQVRFAFTGALRI